MMSDKRGTLTLSAEARARKEALAETYVTIGLLDVLLPARQFTIDHKVAELGQVSLTTEFLLRLLYSADGMEESDVANFFGFSFPEITFVINEAESRSFVVRHDGRIFLTDEGFSLFKGEKYPQIFEIESKTEKVGFDMIAMAPCERDTLTDFEFGLPELEIKDEQLASSASSVVYESFWRFYSEIVGRRERDKTIGLRRSLYSVDEVLPGDRFATCVPVQIVSNLLRPAEPMPVLDLWKSGHELSERTGIVNAVASFVSEMNCASCPSNEEAYQLLLTVAPDYLKDYLLRDGNLSIERFLRDSAGKAGELRVDRQTVGVVGPLYSPDNGTRIVEAMAYAKKRQNLDSGASTLFWIQPQVSNWGASRAFVTLLDSIFKDEIGEEGDENTSYRKTYCVAPGKPGKYLTKAFTKILVRPDVVSIPAAVEVLLVPNRIAAVTVHAPVGMDFGYPVPVGIITFEPEAVARVEEYLKEKLPASLSTPGSGELVDWKSQIFRELLPTDKPSDS